MHVMMSVRTVRMQFSAAARPQTPHPVRLALVDLHARHLQLPVAAVPVSQPLQNEPDRARDARGAGHVEYPPGFCYRWPKE